MRLHTLHREVATPAFADLHVELPVAQRRAHSGALACALNDIVVIDELLAQERRERHLRLAAGEEIAVHVVAVVRVGPRGTKVRPIAERLILDAHRVPVRQRLIGGGRLYELRGVRQMRHQASMRGCCISGRGGGTMRVRAVRRHKGHAAAHQQRAQGNEQAGAHGGMAEILLCAQQQTLSQQALSQWPVFVLELVAWPLAVLSCPCAMPH